jgi:hypothetical protein
MPSRFNKTEKRALEPSFQKRLYWDIKNITDDEIEYVLCNGRSLSEMPTSANPIFILKWGPPASGKSSENVLAEIESFGVPLRDYINFTPDAIIESLLAFRVYTTMAKAENIRLKGALELGRIQDIRETLQSYGANSKYGYNAELKEKVNEIISNNSKDIDRIRQELDEAFVSKILYDRITKTYKYFRKTLKNKNNARKRTIVEKMDEFLAKAMKAGCHIQYETMGSGYGEQKTARSLGNQFTTSERFLRSRAVRDVGLIDIYKNNLEDMLGKVIYDGENRPLRIELSNPSAIPQIYNIVVVYPVLPLDRIIQRAEKRALEQSLDTTQMELVGTTKDEYIAYIQRFKKELLKKLFGPQGMKLQKANIARYSNERLVSTTMELLQSETDKYMSDFLALDIRKYFETLNSEPYVTETADAKTLVSLPFYRGISKDKIKEVTEEAFQYAVDYFLKQYILLGRIKGVIYISNV